MIPYDIIGTITGIIGAITGVASLIWHILNNKSKIIVKSVYFKKGGFSITEPRGQEIIGVRILIRNRSDRSATLEKIYFSIGRYFKEPHFHQTRLEGNSSKELEFEIPFSEEDYKEIESIGTLEFRVIIEHTFGKIKIVKKGNMFRTGHLHLI